LKKKSIAIVGAGLGSLSTAIYLRKFGFNVDVYEQSNYVGGKAASIEFNGFRFDAGPTLLTMPFVLKEIFALYEEDFSHYLQLQKLETVCKYFYPDGTVLNAFTDQEKFAKEIEANTTDSSFSVKKYLNYCKTIYDLTADLFLKRSFTEFSTFFNFNALKTLFLIKKIDTNRTMHRANSKYFSDKKTIQLFDRYATYNGSNPFKVPATLNIIQHVEYGIGGFIPEKGIYEIPLSLFRLAEKIGVKFFFNSKVEKIVLNDRKAEGLIVNWNERKFHKKYSAIVSNADVNFTYQKLLSGVKIKQAEVYSELELSTSALVFYWGIKGEYDSLNIHNILFSENYEMEFQELFEKKICPTDPTVYIYISSKYNHNDSPKGYENWYVMINAPYIHEQNWEEEISRSRNVIIDKIKKVLNLDINSKIVAEKILSPEMIEKNTSSYKGSLYGISSNTKFAAFLRQKNRCKEIKGLYFCGGSAHPGGGIPLVLLSGKITAELIKKDEKK